MKDVKYCFIVNLHAGKGRAASFIPKIESLAKAKKVSYEIISTSRKGDGEEIARESVSNGFTHFISVGGDGTSHEIVNGLIGSSAVLGVLPLGSGNDFPKSAGIPSDGDLALRNIFSGDERLVDVGKLEDEYFINGLGIGLDGAVSHRFKRLKRMRLRFGYLLAAVQEALAFKAFQAKISVGEWSYEGSVLLTGASNGFSQGGFKLAPEAKIDDGELDFHAITDMSSMSRLAKIPKVLKGGHSRLSEVAIKRGPSMEISLRRTVPAHMDGESFFLERGVYRIEVIPKSLKILSVGRA